MRVLQFAVAFVHALLDQAFGYTKQISFRSLIPLLGFSGTAALGVVLIYFLVIVHQAAEAIGLGVPPQFVFKTVCLPHS